MNSKYLIPVIASALILTMVFSSFVPAMAQVPMEGPFLVVKTIPQDDQVLKKGIMVLGLPEPTGWPKGYAPGSDLMSQHKLLVSFNGQPIFWKIGEAGVVITCNVLEKDKVNPVPDKFGTPTKQFPQENLVTTLTDVSDKFICKPHWKTPADMPGWYESAGVLDVYYTGPIVPTVIADNILSVTATLVIERVVIQGTDMQDICLLGWSMSPNWMTLTLPDHGATIILWNNAMGEFAGCEQAALEQRYYLGILPAGVVM
jgi:hypothetical protein